MLDEVSGDPRCAWSLARCSIDDLPVVEAGPEHLHRPTEGSRHGHQQADARRRPWQERPAQRHICGQPRSPSMVRLQLGRWGRLAMSWPPRMRRQPSLGRCTHCPTRCEEAHYRRESERLGKLQAGIGNATPENRRS